MPELPEVESVRRQLEPVMTGARFDAVVVRRPDLRIPFPTKFAARLNGRTVLTLTRRAKYLLAALSSGETLLMHLGMSGSFRVDLDARDDGRAEVGAVRPPAVTITWSSTCRPARSSRSTIRDDSASWTSCRQASWRDIPS